MSCTITTIYGDDCIGNSLSTINANFQSLCSTLTSLSTTFLTLSTLYTSVLSSIEAEVFDVPIGAVVPFTFMPSANPYTDQSGTWYICDGTSTIDGTTSQASALSVVIGQMYGGISPTTFAVPDLRESLLVGTSATAALSTTQEFTFNDILPNAALNLAPVVYMIKSAH